MDLKLKDISKELGIENDAHKLLMAVSNYMLENDPIKAMQDIITEILQNLFGDRINSFEIDTVEKRNQLETYFYLVTNHLDPKTNKVVECRQPILSSSGRGLTEVAFLIIRMILLVHHPSKPRKVLFADEPVSILDDVRREEFIQMVKGLAKEFGIQIIMTTHEEEYWDSADQLIHIKLEGDVSHVVDATGCSD